MAIKKDVERRLWASSGGFCQNPTCVGDLFALFEDGKISSLANMAHNIPQSDDGPRSEKIHVEIDRDGYDNLLMLCPTCHTLVDKNADQYPEFTLREWKSNHVKRVMDALTIPIYSTRGELRDAVHKLLGINKVIFCQYGPKTIQSGRPAFDDTRAWQRLVAQKILPNNRMIDSLLEVNETLLNDLETQIKYHFSLHREEFEYNHVSGDKSATAPLFPKEMNSILLE